MLESRSLLSTTVAHPTFLLAPKAGPGGRRGGGFSPAQIEQAYGFSTISFNGTPGTGKGETIAIVDAYNDANIQSDLNMFDKQFGLPATTVIRVNENGGTSYPSSDPTGGWELEESLDVEWRTRCAQATIMLVEASSANDTDLLAAVKYAASRANVVSMSWGGGEFRASKRMTVPISLAPASCTSRPPATRRAGGVAGRIIERAVSRRHGAHLDRGERMVERGRLE